MEQCDHKSVGMLVWKNEDILLIERKRFPFGFAAPAGHVDKDTSFEDAAKRELQEEVGLSVKNMKLLIEGRKENICRREEGNWHYWKVYRIKVFEGNLTGDKDETKQAKFVSLDLLNELSEKTEAYKRGEISESDWEKSPGLEPVWYDWFKELKII